MYTENYTTNTNGSVNSKNMVLNAVNEEIQPLESMILYEHFCEKKQLLQTVSLHLIDTTLTHQRGWELAKKRELITMGISLGNGYFNRERVELILTGMASQFEEVVVLMPDSPALHTYRALGYDEHNANKNMKKHRYEVERYCRRTSEKIEYEYGKNNIRILRWSDITEQACYQEAMAQVLTLYQNHPGFREAILRNTDRYILARLDNKKIDVHQLGGFQKILEHAAHYLLEEMAFHDVIYTLIGKDTIASYYRDLEIGGKYTNGEYGNPSNPHLGWVTYSIAEYPV